VELRPGTIVASQYEILGPLGRGGMGELFRARNTRTERRVALKLLRPDTKGRADAVERFRREARAAGMISSDHVTQVLDVEDDPKLGIAIAFELLDGENLLDRLRRTGPMPLEMLQPLVTQILQGLGDAHAVGIIHRDLKPSNVFLETRPDGSSRVKILDFGISKLPKTIAKTTLTEPGQSLGSFMFMPPEQIQRAATVDLRADIYAVGTLAFQALTGHLPYSARSMVELIQLKTTADPRTLEQASGKPFPPQLEAWVARMLRRKSDDRFQTAAEASAAWRALVGSGAGASGPVPGPARAEAPRGMGGGFAPSHLVSAPGYPQGSTPLPAGYAPLPPARSPGGLSRSSPQFSAPSPTPYAPPPTSSQRPQQQQQQQPPAQYPPPVPSYGSTQQGGFTGGPPSGSPPSGGFQPTAGAPMAGSPMPPAYASQPSFGGAATNGSPAPQQMAGVPQHAANGPPTSTPVPSLQAAHQAFQVSPGPGGAAPAAAPGKQGAPWLWALAVVMVLAALGVVVTVGYVVASGALSPAQTAAPARNSTH
jgi:eukaryotic-like serine/threonine-protein kinase